jgi:transcriptional regulator with XRE-family HTH domain
VPKKIPNPIDVHVGGRVRLRRMLIGMSQERLGELLDLTFQQVQKYEKGTNRIGASRLFQIARHLGVNVQFFFEDVVEDAGARMASAGGFAEANEASASVMNFVSSAEGLELNRCYARIPNPLLRRKILDLVRYLAEDRVGAPGAGAGEGRRARASEPG